MRVLIADDDEFYRHAIEAALKQWGYEVVTASDGNSALQILQGPKPPNIAILDWVMPGLEGIEVCCRIRRNKSETYVYIVLVTSKNQKDDVITGLRAEADDYLIKPFDFQELRTRLQAGERVVSFQAALASQHRELSYRATHDSLTDLWNRSSILDIADRELVRGEREGLPVCLVIADIDHFKEINDKFGHAAGDVVLREVAQRMQSALRSYDFIGRYGGEEFLIVMPHFDERLAVKLIERLRMRVGEIPFDAMGTQIRTTISLGAALSNGITGIESLIQFADKALYRAKARGRNRIEFAGAETEHIERRLFTDQCGSALIEKEGADKCLPTTPSLCQP